MTQGLAAGDNNNEEINDEQMFFVPSLLSPFTGKDHPALCHWQSMRGKYVMRREKTILIIYSHGFVRRFSWRFFPAGFFPRLLLRLVHFRLRPLACWLDAAVIMGKYSNECAFMQLHPDPQDAMFHLEV